MVFLSCLIAKRLLGAHRLMRENAQVFVKLRPEGDLRENYELPVFCCRLE